MADDITIKDAGDVTVGVRTVDKGDGKGERQVVILDVAGGTGAEDLDGPLVVSGPLTDTQLRASSVPITVAQDIALSRTTDTAGVALASDVLVKGTLAGGDLTALTPKFMKISLSATGTVVAAVASKKIRVLGWTLIANGTVNAKWQSHVTPTDLTGLHYFVANGGISVPFSPVGHFETVAGEALDLNLSAAVAVGGSLVYVEV